jgi:hypothetical protein
LWAVVGIIIANGVAVLVLGFRHWRADRGH